MPQNKLGELGVRLLVALPILAGNIWLLYSSVLSNLAQGAGRGQAGFELFYELFRFGLPIVIICLIAMVAMAITTKNHSIIRQPWFLFYATNFMIPVILFIVGE